jgi:radical SAM superfamily enzyme YgiQ (UPF0313 family)
MALYRYYYPLGLASMSAVLQREGHSVVVYDTDHAPEADTVPWSEAADRFDVYPGTLENDDHSVWREIRDTISDVAPQVVGITMLSVKARSAAKVAQICKEANPNTVVVVGADHPSTLPGLVLRDPHIDVVVRGEGEDTFLELIHCLDSKDRDHSMDAVAGISYRKGDQVVHNPPRPLIDDLDGLPHSAIDSILHWDKYQPVDFGGILSSRGCPYRCTFCGVHNVWTRKVRYRSPESVVGEINWLHTTFGTDYISFRDANFTLNRERTLSFCEQLLAKGPSVEWECLTRPDLLDEDLLRHMRRAGCVTIRMGIESGDPEVLRNMRKEIDLDWVRKIARLLHKHDFYWSAYLLFGTPLETEGSIWRTVEFVREIKPPYVTIARYAPIPGTEMCQELQQAGRLALDVSWAREHNLQFGSNYALAMEPEKFETTMRQVAKVLEDHNRMQSEQLGRTDSRQKAVESRTVRPKTWQAASSASASSDMRGGI